MSQRLLYHAFGVREGYEYRSTKYVEGRVEFHPAVKDEAIICPHCQGREHWRRGKRQRRINTLPIGPKEVEMEVVPKCECRVCGKSFEHSPPFAPAYDHFHIIKLADEKIDEIRRGLQRTLELDGQKFIKGTRYLLLYGKENLPPDKRPKLEQALAYNEPLSQAYYLKEELRQLWSQPGKNAAQKHMQDWILKAYATAIQPLRKLANTLLNHARQILSYFDHPITSGIMEGISNKIGRLTRMAYGYRDVDFLHLRIYALYESKDIPTGT